VTRKISKRDKQMKQFNYQLARVQQLLAWPGTRESFEAFEELVYAVTRKYPAHNRRETPARSRMHAMYGKRRNR